MTNTARMPGRVRELETTIERLQHDLDVARAAAHPKKIDAVGSLVARVTSLVRIERDDARARVSELERERTDARVRVAELEAQLAMCTCDPTCEEK